MEPAGGRKGRTMTIEELQARKRALGYTTEQIAEKSGVPVATVRKIFGGVTKSPRAKTLRAIEWALGFAGPDVPLVREEAFEYTVSEKGARGDQNLHLFGKAQGAFTLEDYYSMPEDWRGELIDGVLYDMTSPLVKHQLIGGYIYSAFFHHVAKTGGTCLPMIAPVDVQLDRDNKTMVEPDVLIVCDRSKIKNGRRVFGAPDFVMEVLSPSTRKKDISVKTNKYVNAGVREYWIVDPEEKHVTVILTGAEDSDVRMKHYTFEEKVPVHIWNGDLAIDFKEVYEYYAFTEELPDTPPEGWE